jgi:PIN domain nuclease of toxin-antitoxin system
MKVLLDTHIALWCVNQHEKLSSKVKTVLLNDAHTLHVSVVSAWEIAIKSSLGKLVGRHGGVREFLTKMDSMPITLLPIVPQHLEIVETLPFIHRDPFDRLIIATAKAEGMTLLTADENIHKYDVMTMW